MKNTDKKLALCLAKIAWEEAKKDSASFKACHAYILSVKRAKRGDRCASK